MDTHQLTDEVLRCWKINHEVDIILLKAMPAVIWPMKIPGYQHKTVRTMGAHLHNARCMWTRQLGRKWKIVAPSPVDNKEISVKELIAVLNESSDIMLDLLAAGLDNNNRLPGFPPGAVQFMHYMVAHEAHHRGQLIMASRQLGHPFPAPVMGKLWQWSKMG
jgi:uncharacterized damage-inducible protein DinB